tara:strand:+ start:94860 stop:95030 length:171 start_codon:yes stop_codon:yes gene_type:complete
MIPIFIVTSVLLCCAFMSEEKTLLKFTPAPVSGDKHGADFSVAVARPRLVVELVVE